MDAIIHATKARENVIALMNELRESIASDDVDLVNSCVYDLTTIPNAHLVSILQYNHRQPFFQQMLLEDCISLSEEIDAQKVASEPITVTARRGKSGKESPFQRAGAKRWAAQQNLARVARVRFAPSAHQSGTHGVQHAIAGARTAITSGNAFLATLEIEGLWRNCDLTAFPGLIGVDPEWIEATFAVRREGITIGATFDSPPPTQREQFLKKIGSGLLRDDPASPVDLLVNLCLSRLEFANSPSQRLVNYNNHLFIGAATDGDRADAIQRLRDAFATLPAGPFEVRETRRCHACDGFEFLGHNLSTSNGRLSTREFGYAFEEDFWRFSELEEAVQQNLSSKASDSGHAEGLIDSLAALVAFRRGWVAAYDQCDDVDQDYSLVDSPIDELCEACGYSINQVDSHIRPSMGYFPNVWILGD
jgi:hypothetical protein